MSGAPGPCNPFNSGSTYASAWGWYWATIDCAGVNDSNIGCTTEYWQLPSGWSVAPDDGYTQYMIANHRWGTHVGVTSNGNSYGTQNFSGGFWNPNMLSGNGWGYKANSCSLRVMIRR